MQRAIYTRKQNFGTILLSIKGAKAKETQKVDLDLLDRRSISLLGLGSPILWDFSNALLVFLYCDNRKQMQNRE